MSRLTDEMEHAEDQEPQLLCVNCRWNSDHHSHTPYVSHVRMFYACMNRGIWDLDHQWLLKDEPAQGAGKDAVNVKYLRQNTTIPLVSEIRSFSGTTRTFTLSRRVEGCTLEDLWPELSQEQRNVYAKEVAEYVTQLRGLRSDTMGTVDGELLRDRSITRSIPKVYHYIGASEEEWWSNTLLPGLSLPAGRCDEGNVTPETPMLTRPGCSLETIEELRKDFPACTPYTFTHADLNAQNIIINNGHVAAIIDWELSGFYPVWYEEYALEWVQNPEWCYHLVTALAAIPSFLGRCNSDYIRKFNRVWTEQHPHFPKPTRIVHKEPFCECHPFRRSKIEEL